MEPTPGIETSEYKLTRIAMIVGAVLEAAAGVLHQLQDSGVNAPWFAAVLVVLGVLLQIASLFGYQKGRATVKAAAIQAGAHVEATKLAVSPK